jgi:peptide/nickel transport system permease protein
VLFNLAPGDPARVSFERQQGRPPTPAELEVARERFGLEGSAPERYLNWLADAARGDLGTSFSTGDSVTNELISRFPATLQLAGAATLLAIVIGLPIGILAAIRRNSVIDQVSRGAAMLAASTPEFWLAYLLIILFSVKLQVLPAVGYGGLDNLVLPAFALALAEAAIVARLARSSLLEVLGEDYITTARAKGISERQVVVRHALRNALNAVVTQIGLIFAVLLAYSFIIEVIFVWPGIGRYTVDAIGQRDYTVLQGSLVFAGTVFILVSLAVDLIYLWLDPRMTLGPRQRPVAAG